MDAIKQALQADISDVKQEQKRQGSTTAQIDHITQAVDALKAGQEDIKISVQKVGAKLNKELKRHDRRLENLEHHTGTSDPTKN